MGVRGLTTFVNQHQQFFENYNLQSTGLVIDGYGLMSQFYFDHSIDPENHGGEFQRFYSHCAHFFQNLLNCNIRLYIVFDGGYDMDGKKFETMKERCQKKIGSVKSINNGKHAFIMPTMTSEVFKKVIKDFKIPFVFSDFEADRDIAVLANELQCPVLGQDSDFFVMNIHNGYIPFDRLEWRHPSSLSLKPKKGERSLPHKKQSFVRCQRYKLRKFCGFFQVESCLMPLFASVSGNDYLQSISLNGFFGATKIRHQQKPDGKPHPRHKGNNKFCEVLHHFTFYKSFEECLDEVIKHVQPSERSKVKLALNTSCDMYQVITQSPIVDFFKQEDSDLSTSSLVSEYAIPPSFVRLLHKGEVPTMCLNIYLNRMYFVGTQVEKLSEPRSSLCSDDLFRTLSGVMLVDVVKELKSQGKMLTIDIYDRENMHVKCFKQEPLCEVPFFGEVPSFRGISALSEHKRLSFLLACLKANDIDITNIPEHFQLVLLVTNYWFRHSQPQVPQNLLIALVISWIQGVAWCQRNATHLPPGNQSSNGKGFDGSFHWDSTEYMTILHNFDALATRKLQRFLNLNASHGLAQWVSCARITDYINAVLLQVFPRVDMTVLFNGLLIHNVYHSLIELHPSRHQEWIYSELFSNALHASDLFKKLMGFLSYHLGLQAIDAQRTPTAKQQTRGHHRGGSRNRGSGRNHRGGRGSGANHGYRGRGGSRRNPIDGYT